MEKIYIITGMEDGFFNISFFSGFPQKVSQNKNQIIKWMNIVNELELTNEDLMKLYDIHQYLINSSGITDEREVLERTRLYWKYYKLCKSIIHDLRSISDMLILMTSIIIGDNTVKFESVGDYLYKHIDKGVNYYDSDCEFFELISKLDNSIKHHFTNDLYKEMTSEEPCYICIYCSNNWDYANYKHISVSIVKLVAQFNHFYQNVLNEIRSIK